MPTDFQITKLTKFGSQPVSIGGGVRYWAETPQEGRRAWARAPS